MIDYREAQWFFQLEENNFVANVSTKLESLKLVLSSTAALLNYLCSRLPHSHLAETQTIQIRPINQ